MGLTGTGTKCGERAWPVHPPLSMANLNSLYKTRWPRFGCPFPTTWFVPFVERYRECTGESERYHEFKRVRIPTEANNLYYWLNRERKVEREKKERKEMEGKRGA